MINTTSIRILFLVCLSFPFYSQAQVKDAEYKLQADAVKKEIWNTENASFKNYVIPEKYKKYSKVIISRENDIKAVGTKKFKFYIITAGTLRTLTFTSTFHEMVKINDAAALDEYKELSFIKSLRFGSFFGSQNSPFPKESLTTFIGVRIIKPNGIIKQVDADEAVMTKNTSSEKKAKLAIPELAIGDIIDYFIQTITFSNIDMSLNPVDFYLGSSGPILHYAINVEANKKFAVVYRTINNAPDFKIKKSTDDDNLLHTEINNIDPYPLDLWMSESRQVPIIRVLLIMNNYFIQMNLKGFKEGEIYKNSPIEKLEEMYKTWLSASVTTAQANVKEFEGEVKPFYEAYIEKNRLSGKDENELAWYYALRYSEYFKPSFTEKEIVVNNSRNYYSVQNDFFLHILNAFLFKHKSNPEYILACSRFSYNLSDVLEKNDMNLYLKSDHYTYTDNGIYDAPNHIPVSSEGEKGFRLQFRKMAFSFGSAVGKPSFDDIAYNPGVITDAEKNQQFQEINISFNPANPGTVHLKRSTKITGALKASEQKNLLLFEDELNAERENLGLKKTFLDELKENKKTRSLADEYSNAFAQARKEYKTYFENEVKAEFDMQPENLTDYKVIQSGRFINKPEMIYSSEFDLTGLIKKAGKNYIFETGKLIGSQVKIIPEQRDRNVDVYMANTRSYKNKIIFSIPDGYSIEGLDKLNVSVNNETGAFNASALVNNGILTIETEKKYSNPVLKAEQWPLLLKVIDAANDFTNSRILLRKN